MAMNPMQRRARNSFLVGFLIAIIIMALVVVLLLYQMKGIKAERDKLVAARTKVFVANTDLKSGQILNQEEFKEQFVLKEVITDISSSDVISADDFEFKNDQGEIETRLKKDGSQSFKKLIMKIAVPSGTIVTKDMFEEEEKQLTDSQRIQEYSMIVLPSQLKNNDYIDIRLALPSGQDYIVLPKKQVLGTNENSIWLQLAEEEILTLNNAIVESYTITGSKLYAIPYVEAGRQAEPVSTYSVSATVLTLMSVNPNITEEAINALKARYNTEMRINYLEPALDANRDNQESLVSAGFAADIENAKTARQTFVEELEGSDDIGYKR